MQTRGRTFWRLVARSVFVPLFAWLLAAQSIALPLARAKAIETRGSDVALIILCSSTLPMPGDAGDDTGGKQVHDFGCCTLAGRMDLESPVAVAATPPALEPVRAFARPLRFSQAEPRAPPPLTARPLQPRAPPSLA